MTFHTNGFLGQDALRLIDEQRTQYPDLFLFALECSTTALKSASLPITVKSGGVAVGVMFARCIAQFQSAIILAERGLSIESMLLTRALFETVFVLGALAQGKVTPKELADSDNSYRKTIGNAILPIAKEAAPPEHYEKLAAFIAEHKEATHISIYDMAIKAGMQVAYDGIYRHLSHFAAHPSVTAASEYYIEPPNGPNRVLFRPLTTNTPEAVLAACDGILLACGAFEKATQTKPEINIEINARLDREESLFNKYRPWSV